jgi:hypothetical protein
MRQWEEQAMRLKRILGAIIGAFFGMTLGGVLGVILGITCSVLIHDPNWAFDGLTPIACGFLVILSGLVLGAIMGWRHITE